MRLLLGSIRLGTDTAITGPTSASTSQATSIAIYAVNRGKPIPHVVGDELTTKEFSFFFNETFCNVATNLARLETAFATKSPLALVIGNGLDFRGLRYIVAALDIEVLKTDRSGNPVSVEGGISLLEDPLPGGLGLQLDVIARARAIARGGIASLNAIVRR
ncbi:MAG: phage tail protein [Rhizobiales bacterium]|nr:phage tail protein [Hyphomicrobiales bacterium]